MVLHVKFKTHVAIADGHVLLCEYARHTLREPGVLRCDIVYDITKRGVPKGPYYQIWTTFYDSQAYMQHERTSHATKLRIYIDGGTTMSDTATLLTKLAYRVSVLRPLFPAISAWRSSLQRDEDEELEDEREGLAQKQHRIRRGTPNLGKALEISFSPPAPTSKASPAVKELNKQKQMLNQLFDISGFSNVNTVKIQICEATAKSSDDMRHAREKCESYLKNWEKNSGGIIRTALLVDRSNPLRVILMSVHDPADYGEGIYFDSELAEEHLVENPRNKFSLPWTVSRLASVFPDLIGWEKYIDHDEAVRLGFERPSLSSPSPSFLSPKTPPRKLLGQQLEEQEQTGQLQQREAGSITNEKASKTPNVPGYRLIYGYTAFNKIKTVIRETAGVPNGECRILLLPGWNQARLVSLVTQIEYDPRSDPGPIVHQAAESISHGAVTVAALRRTLNMISKFDPHLLIACGGSSVMDFGKLVSQFARCEDIPSALSEFEAKLAANETGHLKLPGHSNPFPLLLMPIALGPGVELTDLAVVRHPLDPNTLLQYKSVYIIFQYDHSLGASQMTHKTVLIDSRLCAPRRLPPFDAGRAALYNSCVAIDTFFCFISPSLSGSRSGDDQEEMTGERLALTAAQLYTANFTRALREPSNSSGEARDVLTKAGISLGMAMDSVGRPGIAVRLANAVLDLTFYDRPDYAFRHILTRVCIAYIDIVQQRMPSDLFNLDEVFRLRHAEEENRVGRKNVVDTLLRMADQCNIPLLRTVGLTRRKVPDVCNIVERQLNDLNPDICSYIELVFRKNPKLLEVVLNSALDQTFEL